MRSAEPKVNAKVRRWLQVRHNPPTLSRMFISLKLEA